LTIEETYELSDAIMENDLTEIRKEIGDLFLHLVFYSKIGSEKGAFDVTDVLNGLCEKLIGRHPHIYGDVVAETEEQVKANWEALKLKEGNKSVLSGVPGSLPSLVKAMRIQEKARGAGFDWEEKEQVWEKVEEELGEFKETFVGKELTPAQKEEAEGELGDLIFSLVNFARFIDINPDQAVERTNRKFIYRFQHLERRAAEMGMNLQDMTLTEMDVLWNEAKVTLPGLKTPAASTGEREK
jgi:XTP/dITP diphosphohydrolase